MAGLRRLRSWRVALDTSIVAASVCPLPVTAVDLSTELSYPRWLSTAASVSTNKLILNAIASASANGDGGHPSSEFDDGVPKIATATSMSGIDEATIRNAETLDILEHLVFTLRDTQKPWGNLIIIAVLERAAALSISNRWDNRTFVSSNLRPLVIHQLSHRDTILDPIEYQRCLDALNTLGDSRSSIHGAAVDAFERAAISIKKAKTSSLVAILQAGCRVSYSPTHPWQPVASQVDIDSRAVSSVASALCAMTARDLASLSIDEFLSLHSHVEEHVSSFWCSGRSHAKAFQMITSELIARLDADTALSAGTKRNYKWSMRTIGSLCDIAAGVIKTEFLIEALRHVTAGAAIDSGSMGVVGARLRNYPTASNAQQLLTTLFQHCVSHKGLPRATAQIQQYWSTLATPASAASSAGGSGNTSGSGSGSDYMSSSASATGVAGSASDTDMLGRRQRGDAVTTDIVGPSTTEASSIAIAAPTPAPTMARQPSIFRHGRTDAAAVTAGVWLPQLLNSIVIVARYCGPHYNQDTGQSIQNTSELLVAVLNAVCSTISTQFEGVEATSKYVRHMRERARRRQVSSGVDSPITVSPTSSSGAGGTSLSRMLTSVPPAYPTASDHSSASSSDEDDAVYDRIASESGTGSASAAGGMTDDGKRIDWIAVRSAKPAGLMFDSEPHPKYTTMAVACSGSFDVLNALVRASFASQPTEFADASSASSSAVSASARSTTAVVSLLKVIGSAHSTLAPDDPLSYYLTAPAWKHQRAADALRGMAAGKQLLGQHHFAPGAVLDRTTANRVNRAAEMITLAAMGPAAAPTNKHWVFGGSNASSSASASVLESIDVASPTSRVGAGQSEGSRGSAFKSLHEHALRTKLSRDGLDRRYSSSGSDDEGHAPSLPKYPDPPEVNDPQLVLYASALRSALALDVHPLLPIPRSDDVDQYAQDALAVMQACKHSNGGSGDASAAFQALLGDEGRYKSFVSASSSRVHRRLEVLARAAKNAVIAVDNARLNPAGSQSSRLASASRSTPTLACRPDHSTGNDTHSVPPTTQRQPSPVSNSPASRTVKPASSSSSRHPARGNTTEADLHRRSRVLQHKLNLKPMAAGNAYANHGSGMSEDGAQRAPNQRISSQQPPAGPRRYFSTTSNSQSSSANSWSVSPDPVPTPRRSSAVATAQSHKLVQDGGTVKPPAGRADARVAPLEGARAQSAISPASRSPNSTAKQTHAVALAAPTQLSLLQSVFSLLQTASSLQAGEDHRDGTINSSQLSPSAVSLCLQQASIVLSKWAKQGAAGSAASQQAPLLSDSLHSTAASEGLFFECALRHSPLLQSMETIGRAMHTIVLHSASSTGPTSHHRDLMLQMMDMSQVCYDVLAVRSAVDSFHGAAGSSDWLEYLTAAAQLNKRVCDAYLFLQQHHGQDVAAGNAKALLQAAHMLSALVSSFQNPVLSLNRSGIFLQSTSPAVEALVALEQSVTRLSAAVVSGQRSPPASADDVGSAQAPPHEIMDGTLLSALRGMLQAVGAARDHVAPSSEPSVTIQGTTQTEAAASTDAAPAAARRATSKIKADGNDGGLDLNRIFKRHPDPGFL